MLSQGFEGFRFTNGQIGQNFAIKFDACFFQAVHKSRISHVVQTGGRVDALNPQCAELPFTHAPVTVGVLTCFFHGLSGDADRIFAAARISFGGLDDFFVL